MARQITINLDDDLWLLVITTGIRNLHNLVVEFDLHHIRNLKGSTCADYYSPRELLELSQKFLEYEESLYPFQVRELKELIDFLENTAIGVFELGENAASKIWENATEMTRASLANSTQAEIVEQGFSMSSKYYGKVERNWFAQGYCTNWWHLCHIYLTNID